MKKKITLIFTVLVALTVGFVIFDFLMSRPVDSKNTNTVAITIKKGSSTGYIASVLKEKDLIKSELVFKINSKIFGNDGKYFAGTFGIKKSMSMSEIMEVLKSGKTMGKMVTIVDGTNLAKLAKSLEAKNIMKADEFLKEAEEGDFDYKFLEGIPKGKKRLEGFLYPDTYLIDENDTPNTLINMALRRFDSIFKDKYYETIKKQGKTVKEIITVASIVDREAKTKEDKKKVASVIYNRLKIGMPLQMDSSLAYISGEDKIKASLADTKLNSAYNLYTNKGLPPTPICFPGEDAIEAAINPADTDYLFFVVSEKLDGSTVFSETYEEFLKDKAKFDEAYKEYIKKNPGKV